MLRTSPEQFEGLAREGKHVPVVREILADLDTPLSTYLKVAAGDYSYLLESAGQGDSYERKVRVGIRRGGAYERGSRCAGAG